MNNYEEWFNKTYGEDNIAIAPCKGPTRKSWMACKREILKILKQSIQNCDWSWEEVDKRFIEKIEREI